MSETLREVAIDFARRLARCEANSAFSGFDAWEHSGEYFAGYMERISAADQERACHIDTPIIDWETGETDFICSTCGYNADPQDWAEEFKFCPNCGARVVSK